MSTVVNTRKHILEVAEKHFATHGFAGTSLRALIKDAGVNLAAVHYHFGSKEELLAAVLESFAVPVVAEQLDRLNNLRSSRQATIPNIVRAFYEPPIRFVKARGKRGKYLSMLLGRLQLEPEPIQSLVERQFAGCRRVFIDALCQAAGETDRTPFEWRFEFMLGIIVGFFTRQELILERVGRRDWDAEDAIEMLCSFAVPGMQAPVRG